VSDNVQGVDGRSQRESGLPRYFLVSAHDWGQVLTFPIWLTFGDWVICDRIKNKRSFTFFLMEFFPTQMSLISLFALPSGLEITASSRQEGVLCVSLLATQPISHCPLCGSAATRIHSRYQRRLADLPSTGQPVRFLLRYENFSAMCPAVHEKSLQNVWSPSLPLGHV
jgi:hypothetical protein